MRYSKQRDMILNYLKTVNNHPTAEEVYTELRKIQPDISLGTIYRNLGVLVETGQINSLETSDSKKHYDGHTNDHIHFICNYCNKIYDIIDDFSLNLENKVIENKKIIFYGKCENCLNRR